MFDLTNVEVNNAYDLMEKGLYTASILNAEIKQSKAGNNYINLQFEIVVGKYKGRQLFLMINFQHPNPEVVKIANQYLKMILDAVSSPMYKFDAESKLFAMIMHKPMNIKVDIQVSKDPQFADKNVIKSFSKYSEQQAVMNMHASAVVTSNHAPIASSPKNVAPDFSDIPF